MNMISMGIILHAGNARTLIMEAFQSMGNVLVSFSRFFVWTTIRDVQNNHSPVRKSTLL